MRGISVVVELLLILLILITLSVLFWLFTSGTVKELTKSGTQKTERAREIFSTCMIVDSVNENKIYLKNCGDGVITNDTLNVYIDDEPVEFNMTPEKIRKGEIGTITFYKDFLSLGDHDLKISNPSLQIVQKVEATLPGSCVLDLEFDEGEGLVAYDKSGNKNNGILKFYGDGKIVTGKFGNGLQFDGIDDKFKTSVPVDTSPGAYTTVTFWMYWKGDSREMPMGWQEPYDLYFSSGCFGFNTGESNVLGISWDGLANRWVHVAAIFYNGLPSEETVSLYIDGVKQNIYSCYGSTTLERSVTTSFQISGWAYGSGYYFDGIIDEVRIFDRALTQQEIQAEMQSSTPVSNPVAYWNFEGSGFWVTGKFGNALRFDGIDDYVIIPFSESLKVSNEITVEVLIKPNISCPEGQGQTIIAHSPAYNEYSYWFYICNKSLKLSAFSSSYPLLTTSDIISNPNDWYHIFFNAVRGGPMKIFVNNKEIASGSAGGSFWEGGYITIGDLRPERNLRFNGTIDLIRVYKKVLKPIETVNLIM